MYYFVSLSPFQSCLAYDKISLLKVISEEEYRAWSAIRQEALSAIDEKEESLMDSANRIENNFTLLGKTCVPLTYHY